MEEVQIKPRIQTICAVDVETLGTMLHSPIIQIGAAFAAWDPDKEAVVDTDYPPMYWQFDSEESGLLRHQDEMVKSIGIDGSTLNFHFKDTIYRQFNSPVMVAGISKPVVTYASGQHVIDVLSKVMRDTDGYIAAQNNEFDLAMIKGCSGLNFYNHRRTLDIRIFQSIGMLPKSLAAKTHNALEDAIAELEEIIGLLKSGKITLC